MAYGDIIFISLVNDTNKDIKLLQNNSFR